jgi:hypothetical protein
MILHLSIHFATAGEFERLTLAWRTEKGDWHPARDVFSGI